MSFMLRCLPLIFLLVATSVGAATSLQELMEKDQLRLRSWLEPSQVVVVGQEVNLVIEIATRRWFAGGTRIQHPEIDKLVVLQRDQFATNLSRQEMGQTWVVQQWRLELYPQAAATYAVPSLRLELAVNDAAAGIVRGTLHSEPLQFTAEVPELLKSVEFWLATPAFSIADEFDRRLEQLKPGDAFTRTIRTSATYVTSMMLPTPRQDSAPGLAVYPDNPVLEDRSNRGDALAQRTDRFTYVVEDSGQYQLPEQVFYWWDTAKGEVHTQRLAAITIDAGAAATGTATSPNTSDTQLPWRWMPVALATMLLIGLLIYRLRHPPPPSSRTQLGAASRALKNGDAKLAASLLYDWMNTTQGGKEGRSLRAMAGSNPELAATVEQLLQTAYSQHPAARMHEGPNLQGLDQSRKKSRWRLGPGPIRLGLNPDNSAVQQKASAPP
jgi:hypothetical protein